MPTMLRHTIDIHHGFPAQLVEVDRICRGVRKTLSSTAWEKTAFVVELILREMLNNAVIHGCRRQAHLHINFHLTIREGILTIRVADPGPGFKWRTRGANPQASLAVSGRGLQLLQALCSKVTFNAKGNIITVHRPLEKLPPFQPRQAHHSESVA
jgi:anti-sigma regulatory factor (Ser/Thr protein kinase)